jgi:mono/diheme cytochrome c family protein
MTVRSVLIVLNILALLAIAAYLVWAVLSPKRASTEIEPANRTPFLADEDLESRRLERVQGWALLFAAIVAIALPLYWLHEPSRQSESVSYFDENAAERGEELYADSTMESFDSAVSLACATCHGADGGGGPAPFTLPNGQQVVWRAPALNTVLLRFTEDEKCVDPDLRPTLQCSVTDIITHGRPGTPMPAWGVIGGGAKNDQSIQDLIAFLRTIQLTPEEAQAQAQEEIDAAREQPEQAIEAAQQQLATDQETLDTAAAATRKALQQPDATAAELKAACDEIAEQVESDPGNVVREQGLACRDYIAAFDTVEADRTALAWTRTWAERRRNVSDGQLIFELNCARCHTAGWSTFNPAVPPDEPGGVSSLGLPGGGGGMGGGIGFNIRGSEIQRFGTDEAGGFDLQVEFVATGSVPFKEYGTNGQGTGKMPGYSQMLTGDMIKQVVGYERYCITESTYETVEPACSTDLGDLPRVPPTTTTTAKKAGG